MFIKTQKFLVLGISKSGFAAANCILKKGGICFLYEELSNATILEAKQKLIENGGIWVEKNNIDEIIKDIDVLVVSPGVPINHSVAVKCKQQNKRIMGELEFGFLTLNPCMVGVTGTNGKTTTVTLINHILNNAEIKNVLVGNIGVPVSDKIEEIDKDTVCVAEVSSFQLESSKNICPHISCVLNISPDHLERHYTMENYIFLKKRIMLNQKESEYCVLNYDDLTVKSFSEECKAEIIWVSTKEKIKGAYLFDDKLYFNGEFIMNKEDLSLEGEHNVYNSLFAISVCKLLGVDNEIISQSLKSFKGVPHRIELIGEYNGVEFYNDSKSTNTASTITAINSMEKPTILIIGGSEKGETYDKMFEKIKNSNVIHTILTGASRFNMFRSAEVNKIEQLTLAPNFDCAFKVAVSYAKNGECILLSPGCSSFDEFSNYEERGNRFVSLFNGLNDKC